MGPHLEAVQDAVIAEKLALARILRCPGENFVGRARHCRGRDNVIERCSLSEETGAIDAGLLQLKMQRLLYLREREKYGTPVMLDLFDRERVLSDT